MCWGLHWDEKRLCSSEVRTKIRLEGETVSLGERELTVLYTITVILIHVCSCRHCYNCAACIARALGGRKLIFRFGYRAGPPLEQPPRFLNT